MKSSADSGSLIVQSASFPGSDEFSSALSPRELTRFASGLTRVARSDRLLHDLARLGAVLLEELRKLLVDDLLYETGDPGIAELRLGLTLELRVPELDGDDGSQAFARVLALEVVVLLLQQALIARVLVERAGERATEALEVRSAFRGVDVVGEGEHRLDVRVVPLQRDLEVVLLALPRSRRCACAPVLGLVDVRDEVRIPPS